MAQVGKVNASNLKYRKRETERKVRFRIKGYKCEQCDFHGQSKNIIEIHSAVHSSEKKYQCTFPGCNFRTAWKSALQKHLVTHVADREKVLVFHCDQCDFRTATKKGLKQHKVVHLNSNAFVCDYPSCNFRTKSKPRLKRHKRIKHESENRQVYSCKQCNYSSKIKWNFSNHVKTHSEEFIACEHPGCNFRSRLAWNLKVHTRRYHDPNESFLLYCNVVGCAFKTVNEPALAKHLETHNPHREPKFYCTLCPRSFHGLEAIQRHVSVCHTGEEWYSCKFCKFRCKNSTLLKNHITKAHASAQGEDLEKSIIQERYKCGFCSYTSLHKSWVTKHERIHTGKKPLARGNCLLRASDDSTSIMRTRGAHGRAGEGTVECPICVIKFVQVNTMRKHLKTVHLISTEILSHCHFCNYSSKHKTVLCKHMRKIHGHGSNSDQEESDSLSELDEGRTEKKKYPCRTGSCNYTAAGVHPDTIHNRSRGQRSNKLFKQLPRKEMIFKCNYCSFSSPLAKTVQIHVRKHSSKRQIAIAGRHSEMTRKRTKQWLLDAEKNKVALIAKRPLKNL